MVATPTATDFSVRRDWAAASGGASVLDFNGPDYTDFGCGPEGAIDLSQSSGWGSTTGNKKGQPTNVFVPKVLVVDMGRRVNITQFAVNPTATCGDAGSASTGKFQIETSPDNVTYTLAYAGEFTPDNQGPVGAAVTFPKPVVMEWRNSTWKLQPQTRVTDDGSARVAFEQNRPAQPEDVGGDLKIATFNVLNYFTTLGEDFAGCTSFNDRAGNPIAVNSCPGNGPRGAWNDVSFERQQTKIVNAINTIDADIVSV